MLVAKGKAGPRGHPRGTGIGLGPHSLCRLIREKIIIALVAEPWGQCRAPSLPASAVLVWEQALPVCSHAELDGAVAGWGCGLAPRPGVGVFLLHSSAESARRPNYRPHAGAVVPP